MTEHRPARFIAVPPMHPFSWGTPDQARPLGSGTRGLLSGVLGIDPDAATRPELKDVRLSEPVLSDGDRSALESIVGAAAVSSDRAQRLGRARGKSYLDLLDWRSGGVISAPDACVAPADEDQVLRILELCSERGIAVVPFGGGTSVVGGVNPGDGGFRSVISLDLSCFRDIEDLDEVSGEVTLGAGLTGPEVERLLGEVGWSLGHFPQSFRYATIGGYAATRSSGQNSAGYGRFGDMVRSLTVVTPSGVIDAGRAAPASAAGPDLREVFLGSEGAFGVITKVRVRVHRVPEAVRHEAFRFPDFESGAAGLREVSQRGAGPTVIRLSDEPETMVNLAGSTEGMGEMDMNPGCLCVAMYEGGEADVEARMARTRAILEKSGATSEGPGPAEAWESGRFGAPYLRDSLLDVGVLCETLETATDWSNIPSLHAAVGEAITSALAPWPVFVLCHVSHVYATGASLYFTVVGARADDPRGQWETVKAAASRAIVDGGGTITHHHAVGKDHREYLIDEIGEVGVAVLRGIKSAIDPAGIMNPGTLVP